MRIILKITCIVILLNHLFISVSQAADGAALLNRLLKTQVKNQHLKNHRHIPTRIKKTIVYSGYSQAFLAIKKLIKAGQWQQAYQLQQAKINSSDLPNFLDSNEAGLLALDTKNIKNAIQHFADAEHYLKVNAEKSLLEDGFFSLATELSSLISGVGDLTEYQGAPFERILMLNYKSIAYLLNGERKAYNVTRRAIDWQNIEKKEFDKSIALAKKEINRTEQELNKTSSEKPSEINHEKAKNIAGENIFKIISDQYKRSKRRALSVKSAYVNPFGYYMAGIVQEFDSFEDRFLRDNAAISYKKALKLNPSSKVLRKAVRDIKRRPPRRKRLIQVVIAEGFAPEKKTLQFGLPMPGGIVPVKLPIYEPVTSKVAHIKIKSGRTTLANLSTVADIEAITLRYQLDSLPLEHFKVLASIARSTAENMVWGQLGVFGQVGKSFRESFANPDMRAWMSLPKRLLAARFYVSKRVKNITIISYDKRWRRLATKKVSLPKKTHGFIYARAIDNILNINVNKTLWVKAK